MALACCLQATAQTQPFRYGSRTASPTGIVFVENKGQVRDQYRHERKDIRFCVQANAGLSIFAGNGRLHYQFRQTDPSAAIAEPGAFPAPASLSLYRMDVILLGANPDAMVHADAPAAYHERYYTDWSGTDGVQAASFGRVTYRNIYPHIDWVLYLHEGKLKHEFLVHPGGKVSDIQLRYEGADNLSLLPDGSLQATTPMGSITEAAPVCFQSDGSAVASTFRLEGNVLRYTVAPYQGELLIDPSLEWATYLGGAGQETGQQLVTDQANNLYVSGFSSSASGMATTGAFKTSISGIWDGYLAKYTSSGVLLWATYYGGSDQDYSYGLAVDASNNLYCSGSTGSISGIATPGAWQTTPGGMLDAFIYKFDSSGARLWSTYYGGTADDQAEELAVDPYGNLYATGYSGSTSGIASSGAYQTAMAGGVRDAFLAKFNASGNRLWGTYYGGTDVDGGEALVAGKSGNIYMGGSTMSSSGIASSGAHQPSYAGGFSGDGFLVQFDSSGKRKWATYYGGTEGETVRGLACDATGNIYACGQTASASGIATPGAFKTLNNSFEAFLVRFDTTGKRLWGTYYGDATTFRQENGTRLVTDAQNTVYMVGKTDSSSALATPGAYKSSGAGKADAFIVRFDSTGNRLWGSYFGGSGDDVGFSAAGDRQGNLYVSGYTVSTSGIATPGAAKTVFSGDFDVFIAKFCFEPKAGAILAPRDTLCLTASMTLSNPVPGGSWISKTGKSSFTGSSMKALSAGYDTVLYVVSNNCGADTARKAIYLKFCPAGIPGAPEAASFHMAPNPTTGILSLSATEPIDEVAVLDLSGRVVYRSSPHSTHTELQLQALPAGVYGIRINGQAVQKLVKE